VYDVTSGSSFSNLGSWLAEHSKHGGSPRMVVVCANKVDGEGKRVVSEAEGKKFAAAHGFAYFETSAKSGLNVNELFAALFKGIAAGTNK
jgi:GTPase SAR1 family protein